MEEIAVWMLIFILTMYVIIRISKVFINRR
jgi:hypothetical protein